MPIPMPKRECIVRAKRQPVARKVEPVVGRCKKCNGTGYRHYDHNHMKVCEFCCKHDKGWWDLSPMHYGYIAGGENGCCKAGCGTLLRDINTPNPSIDARQAEQHTKESR